MKSLFISALIAGAAMGFLAGCGDQESSGAPGAAVVEEVEVTETVTAVPAAAEKAVSDTAAAAADAAAAVKADVNAAK